MQIPDNTDNLLYFSRRTIGKGKVISWVSKVDCPKCKKAQMGKPINEKGKVSIRAKEYVCPECNYTEEKIKHEEDRTLEAIYTCPHCGKEGEGTAEYKIKKFKKAKAYIVLCQHCNEKIPITKKLKIVDI